MDNSQLPAYPVARFDEDGQPFLDKKDSGLTKMEAFTMAAMQGLCADPNNSSIAAIAAQAVSIAHATLTELSKQS